MSKISKLFYRFFDYYIANEYYDMYTDKKYGVPRYQIKYDIVYYPRFLNKFKFIKNKKRGVHK